MADGSNFSLFYDNLASQFGDISSSFITNDDQQSNGLDDHQSNEPFDPMQFLSLDSYDIDDHDFSGPDIDLDHPRDQNANTSLSHIPLENPTPIELSNPLNKTLNYIDLDPNSCAQFHDQPGLDLSLLPTVGTRYEDRLIGKIRRELVQGVDGELSSEITSFISCTSENGEFEDADVTLAALRNAAKKKTKISYRKNKSSQYRGVTRCSGRFEAFLCDTTRSDTNKKVYIGGFDNEEDAARAYDLTALKYWGVTAPLNFDITEYTRELKSMKYMTKTEFFLAMRRKSKGFSKGASLFRGVSRNSDGKKWQARLGKGKGLKGIYLGTFDTEEDAAKAYDIASIRTKGENAMTNFDIIYYDVKRILESPFIPLGKGGSKSLRVTPVAELMNVKPDPTTDPIPDPDPEPDQEDPADQPEKTPSELRTEYLIRLSEELDREAREAAASGSGYGDQTRFDSMYGNSPTYEAFSKFTTFPTSKP